MIFLQMLDLKAPEEEAAELLHDCEADAVYSCSFLKLICIILKIIKDDVVVERVHQQLN